MPIGSLNRGFGHDSSRPFVPSFRDESGAVGQQRWCGIRHGSLDTTEIG